MGMDLQQFKEMRKQFPKNTTFSSNCPKCHGTGWELYQSSDGTESMYGKPVMIDYAKRCNCKNNALNNEDRTEFPSLYHDCDIYKFDFDCYNEDTSDLKTVAFSFFNQFEEWQKESKGLYLWSKTPGSGKTFLSACLAKSVMMRTQKLVKYVMPMKYFDDVSYSYNNKNEIDPSKGYRECTLLVLDDLGTQLNNEWYSQELFRLIDYRTTNGLVTIITSNYPVEHLKVDERVKSRILKSSITVHMPEVSIRNQKAAAEQGEFINKLLGGK